jgi:hypothetical protein
VRAAVRPSHTSVNWAEPAGGQGRRQFGRRMRVESQFTITTTCTAPRVVSPHAHAGKSRPAFTRFFFWCDWRAVHPVTDLPRVLFRIPGVQARNHWLGVSGLDDRYPEEPRASTISTCELCVEMRPVPTRTNSNCSTLPTLCPLPRFARMGDGGCEPYRFESVLPD